MEEIIKTAKNYQLRGIRREFKVMEASANTKISAEIIEKIIQAIDAEAKNRGIDIIT